MPASVPPAPSLPLSIHMLFVYGDRMDYYSDRPGMDIDKVKEEGIDHRCQRTLRV